MKAWFAEPKGVAVDTDPNDGNPDHGNLDDGVDGDVDENLDSALDGAEDALSVGDLRAAEHELRVALALHPEDARVRIGLGHVAYVRGDIDEAFRQLTAVVNAAPADVFAPRSLMEMYRLAGRVTDAMNAAQTLAHRAPKDIRARVELADLQFRAGRFDDALRTYRTLRVDDPEPGHAVYALHGMVECELARDNWRPAMELAVAATAVDRHRLTTDVLLFLHIRLFGTGATELPVPNRRDLERELERRRDEHRMLHGPAVLGMDTGSETSTEPDSAGEERRS